MLPRSHLPLLNCRDTTKGLYIEPFPPRGEADPRDEIGGSYIARPDPDKQPRTRARKTKHHELLKHNANEIILVPILFSFYFLIVPARFKANDRRTGLVSFHIAHRKPTADPAMTWEQARGLRRYLDI